MTKKVVRFFMAWQNDLEEKWLTEMSLKGWELKNVRLGLYTFKKIEPANYIYKLDYPGNVTNLNEYYSIFQDSGWEPVTNLFGWHYFRAHADRDLNSFDIYSDLESKTLKYRLLSTLLLSITLSLLVIFFTVLLPDDRSFTAALKWLYFFLFGFNAFAIVRLQMKIKRVKDK